MTKRRTSVRLGPLDIPEELVPKDTKLRWVSSNPAKLARKMRLGYEAVNANSPEFKELAECVGDQTMADGKTKRGSVITKLGTGGTNLILMQISLEKFNEHQEERRREVNRREELTGDSNPNFYGKELKQEHKESL